MVGLFLFPGHHTGNETIYLPALFIYKDMLIELQHLRLTQTY